MCLSRIIFLHFYSIMLHNISLHLPLPKFLIEIELGLQNWTVFVACANRSKENRICVRKSEIRIRFSIFSKCKNLQRKKFHR
jgi:2-phospho-L-lactate guanylyltransferase (CobY/MobA/RfbA family)